MSRRFWPSDGHLDREGAVDLEPFTREASCVLCGVEIKDSSLDTHAIQCGVEPRRILDVGQELRVVRERVGEVADLADSSEIGLDLGRVYGEGDMVGIEAQPVDAHSIILRCLEVALRCDFAPWAKGCGDRRLPFGLEPRFDPLDSSCSEGCGDDEHQLFGGRSWGHCIR